MVSKFKKQLRKAAKILTFTRVSKLCIGCESGGKTLINVILPIKLSRVIRVFSFKILLNQRDLKLHIQNAEIGNHILKR